MTAIYKTIEIPADRRLNLRVELPDELPPGQAEMHLLIFPSHPTSSPLALKDLAGSLKTDTAFTGDALEIQKKMRYEW